MASTDTITLSHIGLLSNLNTVDKSNIVNAINEVYNKKIGNFQWAIPEPSYITIDIVERSGWVNVYINASLITVPIGEYTTLGKLVGVTLPTTSYRLNIFTYPQYTYDTPHASRGATGSTGNVDVVASVSTDRAVLINFAYPV